MVTKRDLYLRCANDPQFESDNIKLGKKPRPLRGPQAELIKKIEKHIANHDGEVMPVRQARQTGKNEVSAVLHRRHLWRRQRYDSSQIWIRTAPTHKPQIVNSKKRLRELLNLSPSKVIKFPLFNNAKLATEEGYIWRVGNASVEFISSGPQANVVGGTANVCLDMDEAHKVDKDKFDEDFAPMAANTSAGILLWGVADNGLDLMSFYREHNKSIGREELNIDLPAEVFMEVNESYAKHVEARISALGYDHPIIKTQYRLLDVSSEGNFLNSRQVRNFLSGQHERELTPRSNDRYQVLVDIAASNENNMDDVLEGNEDAQEDSTTIWIYKISPILTANGIFPIIQIVNTVWLTGVSLPIQEEEIESIIRTWRAEKVTIDSIGVGRHIGESMVNKFGDLVVKAYTANPTTVSEDCFDLLARLNHNSVQMFQNDGSKDWAEIERQLGWTKYASKEGKMKLIKPPGAKKHIDFVKALTYINQNNPENKVQEFYSSGTGYSV